MKNFSHVLLVKALIDILVGGLLCSPIAFLLRLEWNLDGFFYPAVVYTALSMLALAAIEFTFRLPWRSWRSSGMNDLLHLSRAILFYGFLMFLVLFLISPALRVPRSIPIIDGALTFLSLGGLRFVARFYSEKSFPFKKNLGGKHKLVLIVGAGEAGIMIAREMLRHPEAGLEPVGFLDDDPSKGNSRFIGLPVCGLIDDLPKVTSGKGVEEILISIPSAEGQLVRHIVGLARKAGVNYRIIPGIYEVLSGSVSISLIRDVDVSDLLGREQVTLDMQSISGFITGKSILVTGAGGSIGSEIVRQVCGYDPARIIMLGRGENSLFEAENSLNGEFPDVPRETVVADVRNERKMRMVFERHRPQVVFHAAAHKHVPMMEKNPDQAILNNIGGTKVMTELALEFGVESFVNISTDKAVNPTSVMGATKRISEMVVRDAASRAPEGCSFVSVRFGNVLGSRGSVIPLFREQIRKGGPVTVTHPEMTRYFMTIPEAAQLVLQAAAIDGGGTVYVLDMGKPVKIKDLAEDLIQLSGFEPHVDIEIVYTGIRPGEKLFEEILTSEEDTTGTIHDKIYISPQKDLPPSFGDKLDALLTSASRGDDLQNLRKGLRDIVPAFRNGKNTTDSEVPHDNG